MRLPSTIEPLEFRVEQLSGLVDSGGEHQFHEHLSPPGYFVLNNPLGMKDKPVGRGPMESRDQQHHPICQFSLVVITVAVDLTSAAVRRSLR